MTVQIGCYGGVKSVLDTFTAEMSAATVSSNHRTSIDPIRVYCGANSPTNGNTQWAATGNYEVHQAIADGHTLMVSWSPNVSWDNVATGSEDARVDSIATFAAQMCNDGKPHYFVYNHEPENDANGTVAGWKNSMQRMYTRFRAIAPTNCRFSTIYMFNTLSKPDGTAAGTAANAIYPNQAARAANDWFTPYCDVLGIDYYNYRGPSGGYQSTAWCDPNQAPLGQGLSLYAIPGWPWYHPSSKAPQPAADPEKLQYWVDYSVARGGPGKVIFGEITSYLLNPGVPYPPSTYSALNRNYTSTTGGSYAERLAWVQAWATVWANKSVLEAVCWYERDAADGWPNGRLSTGSLPGDPAALRAWSSLGDGTPVSTVPTISSFLPQAGPSGTVVVIGGTNFVGTTIVRFGGVSASFIVNSATQITATVPALGLSGPIQVTNASGTGTSSVQFTVGSLGSGYVPGSISPMTRTRMAG